MEKYNMNILVLGKGGREHSICYELSMSNKVGKVYCAPGNAGIALVSKIAKIDANNFMAVLKFCRKKKYLYGHSWFRRIFRKRNF